METYAERLQKEKEKTMTNYDMDELRRRGEVPDDVESDRNAFASVKVKVAEKDPVSIEIELPDDDILKLALAAHDRDITLNQLCVTVLKSSFRDLDYRFEHGSDLLHSQTKPQVLKEY